MSEKKDTNLATFAALLETNDLERIAEYLWELLYYADHSDTATITGQEHITSSLQGTLLEVLKTTYDHIHTDITTGQERIKSSLTMRDEATQCTGLELLKTLVVKALKGDTDPLVKHLDDHRVCVLKPENLYCDVPDDEHCSDCIQRWLLAGC